MSETLSSGLRFLVFAVVTVLATALLAMTIGNYNFTSIPAGTWEVTVTANGYKAATKMVQVTANMPSSVNFTLTP